MLPLGRLKATRIMHTWWCLFFALSLHEFTSKGFLGHCHQSWNEFPVTNFRQHTSWLYPNTLQVSDKIAVFRCLHIWSWLTTSKAKISCWYGYPSNTRQTVSAIGSPRLSPSRVFLCALLHSINVQRLIKKIYCFVVVFQYLCLIFNPNLFRGLHRFHLHLFQFSFSTFKKNQLHNIKAKNNNVAWFIVILINLSLMLLRKKKENLEFQTQITVTLLSL